MLYTNQHILGVFDTETETLVTYPKSLENIGAYSVTFHVNDVEAAGLTAAVLTASVKAETPAVEYPSAGVAGITLVAPVTTLVPAGTPSVLWTDTSVLNVLNTTGLAMSDSGFGYKTVDVVMSIDTPTATQFLVTAILHTTTLKS